MDETLQKHVEACGDNNKRKALVLPASRGDAVTVRALAEQNIYTVFSNEETALMVAAERGHESMVRVLVGLSAQVDAIDSDLLQTALTRAASNGHVSTVRALVELSAQVDAVNSRGQTVLMLAASEGA